MKRAINIFTAFIIFTTIVVLLTFCQNVNAQTANAEKQNKEKLEKLEVQKFVDEFIKNFEDTKDLNQVPERFFVADFKTRSLKDINYFDEYPPEVLSQISNEESYEFKILLLDNFYLSIMSNNGICCDGEEKEFYPPEILKIIKKSKFLSSMLIDDTDLKITSIQDFHTFKSDMKNFYEAQRKYLESRPTNWKNEYIKNVIKTRKNFESFYSYLCSEDDCENLLAETRIIEIAAFPFILKIIKENNDYKILDVFPYSQ